MRTYFIPLLCLIVLCLSGYADALELVQEFHAREEIKPLKSVLPSQRWSAMNNARWHVTNDISYNDMKYAWQRFVDGHFISEDAYRLEMLELACNNSGKREFDQLRLLFCMSQNPELHSWAFQMMQDFAETEEDKLIVEGLLKDLLLDASPLQIYKAQYGDCWKSDDDEDESW